LSLIRKFRDTIELAVEIPHAVRNDKSLGEVAMRAKPLASPAMTFHYIFMVARNSGGFLALNVCSKL